MYLIDQCGTAHRIKNGLVKRVLFFGRKCFVYRIRFAHKCFEPLQAVADFSVVCGEFRQVDVVTLLEETLLLLEHHPLFGDKVHIDRKFPRRAVALVGDADKLRQLDRTPIDKNGRASGPIATSGLNFDKPNGLGDQRVMDLVCKRGDPVGQLFAARFAIIKIVTD